MCDLIVGRANKYEFELVEAAELCVLLVEMEPEKFTHSKQLSAYIVKHKPGYRYPHISGILRMRGSGTEWDFHGGFPSDIYRIICKELGLDNQRTDARAIKFTSFAEIEENKQLNQQQRELDKWSF